MKKFLLLFAIGLIPFLSFSQETVKSVKEKTISEKQEKVVTNVAALRDFASRKSVEWQLKRAEAEEFARQNNLPIIFENDEGTYFELQYISDDGVPMYYQTDNANAAATISTDQVYSGGSAGLSLDGSGITVREWDGGAVRVTHQEYGGRVVMGDGASTTHYHSTHVAGTIMASGVQSNAKGMAYNANLRAFDWNSDETEMANEAAGGALMSNHSYGYTRGWSWDGSSWTWYGNSSISTLEDYRFGFYDSGAQEWDQIAHDAPYYLICKSSGNDRNDTGDGPYPADGNQGTGYDCIGTRGISKNLLTVGAVNDIPAGYSQPSDVVMSSFSSWGPADDGRIKPDIVANGVGLYSTYDGSDTDYNSISGTSMATPSATGSLALLQEHWENLNGSGNYMLASTLKAIVIHTADEAGSNDGPDYEFGWGLMNTESAALKISDDQTINVVDELTLNNGSTYNRTVYSDGSEPLKITICWTDVPGTPVAAQLDPLNAMLVNDLDLRITKDASTFYPWKLSRNNPTNAATNSSENNVDNVEVVYIASPVAGNYTVTVDHDGTLDGGSQVFSIIYSGISVSSNPPSITTVSPSSLYEDRGKQITITGSDLLGSSFEIGGVAGSEVSNNGSTAIVDFPPANYSNSTLTITNSSGSDTWTVTVSTRNTIPVNASTGANTDLHQTIDAAVDGLAAWYGNTAFNAGDLPGTKTIEVANGTYNESVTLNSILNPTAANPLIIKPSAGATPIVNASGQSFGFNLSTVDYVELNGFTVHDATFDNIYAQGDNVTITMNKCYGATGGSGIKVQTGTPFTVTNNLCYGNYKYGIHIDNTNNAVIKNNTNNDNGGTYAPATGVTLFNEEFESGSYAGWTTTGGSWGIYDDATYARSPTHFAGMTDYTSGELTYSSVNISGYTNIVVSCWYRDIFDLELTDNIKGEYQLDGGGWVQFFSDNASVDSYIQAVSAAINTGGTANSLEIRFTATCGASEYWAVDDITVTGDEAGTATNTGAGLYVESGTGSSVQDNIFQAKTGNNAYYALITESGVTVNSDYNTYYTTNSNLFDYNGTVGNTGPMSANDLNADPLFISSSDYHIFSTSGSYHGGEWPPLTASSGTWTNDASDSPAIDSGNPADDYSNEPESGGRINQGAYGNTAQASKSGSCTYPSNQATTFTATAGVESISVGWTRGNGDAVLVVARDGSAVNQDPADGTTYTANAAFGSGTQIGTGNYVVYDGTGTSVNVTGLTSGNTYHFAIYEYSSTGNCYLTPALTGNKTTLVPTVFAGANAGICEGDTYTILDATASNYTSLLWSTSGDGSFNNTTVLNPIYTPGSTDISTGSVTLTLTAQPGSISDEMILTITPLTTADAGQATDNVCYNASYTAAATVTNGTILWTTSGDGSFADATAEDAVYTPGSTDISSGTVTLTMTVTGSCNTASDNVILTIDAEATADAGPATDNVCYNASYTAAATATNGTILWTTSGDGSFADATAEDAVYTLGATDNGTVTLTMTVTGSCNTASDNVVLTIDAEATADAGPATDNVCYNASYTAAATATNGTILWTTSGDGGFADATAEDAVYTPGSTDISTGTVTLTMTVTGSCNTASDNVILTIDAAATADAGQATDNVCYTDSYTAAATATNGTILWTTSGDGSFADATIEDAVYTPGSTDISTGTVTLTMTVTGTCNTASDNVVLTIDAEATADAGPATDNVCYNASYTAAATATNGTILWTTSGDGSFADDTAEDAVYTLGATDNGTVTLTMTVTGTCNTASDNVVLTIDAEATADAGLATDNVCYTFSYTAVATATNGTILWTTSGDGSFADATAEDAVYTPGSTDISTGTVTLTMTVTGSCNTASDNVILTIDAEATADAGPATDNVCYNASYTAAATATNGTILWTTSGDGSFADATAEDAVYTLGATDNGTVTLTMTVTGSCNTASDNVILTIDAEATADAGPATDNVCYTDSYTAAATATNGTILWTTSGDGSFADATAEDAVYTPGSTDISTGTVTLTMTVTGSCNTASDNVILTIDAEATADAGPATDNVCYNASYTAAATATNGTILWTTSGDGSFADATAEDAVYTLGATDNGTVTLTMTVTGSCNTASDNVILTIDAEATADAGPATDNVCYTDSYTAAATATNGTILWTTSGDGSFADATAEDAVYTPGSTDISTGTVTLTMTVTGSCNTASDNVILTIDAEATADAGPATDNVCYNASYTAVATATNGTILWTTSGDGSFADATAEDAVYTLGATDNGTVTLTMTVTGSCNTASDNVILTIDAEATADAGPATDNVCYTDSYTAAATATNGTILWTTSGDGSFADATIEDAVYTPGSTDISSGTVTLTMTVTGSCNTASDNVILTIDAEATADAGPATDNVCYNASYTAAATATNGTILWTTSGDGSFADATAEDAVYTLGATDNGTVTLTMTVTGSCNTASDNVILTIDAEATADAGPATDNVCYNASYTAVATATNGTILWTTSGDGSFADATAEDAVYTPSSTDISSGTVTLTMTVTGSCNTASDNVILTIDAEATADAGPATDNVCYNASYTAAATATNGTILWTTSGDGSFADATAEDAVYTLGATDNGTVTLTMTVTGSCNTASDNVVLTIDAEATADAGPATDNVCYNASYTAAATATNGTILWTTSGDGGFADATAEDAVYTPGSTDISTGTVTLTMTVTGSCNTASDNVILTIDAAATADAGQATDNVCYTDSYTAAATATNGTIFWTTSGDGSFADATIEDAVYTPGSTDISTGTVTLTMTVTGTCNTASDNVVLTIDAEATADAGPATDNVCYNASYTAAATATNGTILWTTSGDGSFADDTAEDAVYTLGATDNGTVTLTMTVTGTCNTASDNVVLTIDAEATADAGLATDNVCYTFSYTAVATATNGTILWTTSGDGSFADATAEDAVYTPGSTDISTGTVTLTMTVTGSCNTASDNVILTIDAEATADAGPATDNVCYNASYTAAATATNGTILWTTSGDGSFADATAEDAVYTLGATDNGTVTLTMTVTGSCNTASDNVILTIDAEATADAGPATDNVCYTDSYTAAATATNGTILWTTSGDGSFADATAEDAVYTPGSTDISTGTVTLTMTVTGSCNTASDNVILTIDAEATADAGPATDNVCYNASYTAAATATNGTILWTTSGDGSFADATAEDAVYTLGATDNGTVTLTMTVTGSCNTASDNVILTIDAEATADAGPATDNVCYTDSYTAAATATNGTILWTTSGDGSFADATIEDAVYTPSSTDISTGTVTLTMTVTGSCNTASDNVILTIDAEATADAGPATDNVCYNASYTAVATATNGTILWTTSGDGSFADATAEDAVYTLGATDNGTVTLTMTVTGSCNTASDNVILTIDAEATADAGPATDNVCYTDSYTAAATATNGTILWTTSGDGSFADATIEDAVYTPGSTDISSGTVTLTMTVTGSCNTASDNVILTIDAEATADAGLATDNVCYNASYTAVATATNGTILWTTSGDGSFADATAEDAVYTLGATDNGTVTLTMTVTGSCNTASDNVILTIDAEATADAGPATDNVCYNASYTAAATATNGTILWTTSGDGSFADATAEDAVYTLGATDNGTVTLTMTVTGSCNTASDNVVLTIDAEATADAGPATDNVCYNASYTAAATVTNGTILWTTSGDGSFADATAEDAVYTLGATDNGTVTLTMTVTGSCNTASDNVVLTIDAEATADAGPATDNVCYTDSYTAAATATNGTILWTTSGDGSFADATAEDAVYTLGATDNGTVTLTMTVTGSCNTASDNVVLTIDAEATADAGPATDNVCYTDSYTAAATATNGTILWTTSGDGSFADATAEDAVYTLGATDNGTVTLTMTVTGSCNTASDNVVLTIDAEATADAGPATDNVCYTDSYTAAATATNGTILWTTSGDGSFADATAEDAVYTLGATDNGTVTLTMTVTGSCNTASDNVILTIDAEATADAGPATDNVCYNASYTAAATATNGTILWTTSGDGGFADATAEDAVYTPGSTDISSGTVTLTMTVTGSCNTASDNVILTIDAEATADAGSDATICEGNSYTVNDAAASNYTTIVWTHNGTGSLTDATTLTPTYNPGTGETGVVTLTLTVSGDCAGATDDMTITIDLDATADAGSDATICEGNSYTVTDAAASNYTTIVWTHNGTGSLTDATTLTPTYNPGTGETGVVTLTLTVSGDCAGATDDMTITIDPDATADAGLDATICEGNSYTVTDAAASNYTTIVWTHNGTGSLTDATTLTPTYNPGTGETGVVTLTLTVSGDCAGATDDMTITIDPDATADAGLDATICEGNSYTVTDAAASNYTTIVWTHNGTGSLTDATTLTPTYNPGTGETGVVTLTLTVSGDCAGATDDMTITIDPDATADAGSDATICEGNSYTVTDAAASNYTTIVWTHNGTGSLTDATTLTPTYNPGTGETGVVTLTLTVSGDCAGATDDMTITIDPDATADAGSDATICEGNSYTVTDAAASNYTTIVWTHNGTGSLTDATTLTPTYNPGTGETGVVTLTLTVSGDCAGATDDMTITIDLDATADAGLDATICEGNSYTVTDAAASNYTTIVWTHNGTGSLTDATTLTPTYNPGTGETGVVTLTLTVSGDCAGATDDMVITISPIAYVDAGDDGIVCESGSYDLNGSASDYSSILWSTSGDGIFEDPTDLNTTYFPGSSDINNGSVIILLTAEGIPPCSDPVTDDMLLIISGDPIADAGEDGIVCENESYTLDGYAENYETILWSTSGDGAFDNSSIINATYTPGTNDIVSGLVILSLTAEGFGNCDPASDDMNLEISYLPVVDAGLNDTICQDDSYVLSGFVENASDILWITAGDGNFDDPTLIDATYTPGEGDIFIGGVELTLTANAVAPCDGIYMDDMFLTIEVCGYVSGNLFDNVEFKIAPNPANEVTRFYIENLNTQEVTIEIMDMKGSLISSDNYQVINGKVEGRMILIGLEEGVYNIRAKAKGYLKTLRLIVTK